MQIKISIEVTDAAGSRKFERQLSTGGDFSKDPMDALRKVAQFHLTDNAERILSAIDDARELDRLEAAVVQAEAALREAKAKRFRSA